MPQDNVDILERSLLLDEEQQLERSDNERLVGDTFQLIFDAREVALEQLRHTGEKHKKSGQVSEELKEETLEVLFQKTQSIIYQLSTLSNDAKVNFESSNPSEPLIIDQVLFDRYGRLSVLDVQEQVQAFLLGIYEQISAPGAIITASDIKESFAKQLIHLNPLPELGTDPETNNDSRQIFRMMQCMCNPNIPWHLTNKGFIQN